ncbi:MAG: SpoIIE family protein phosphatase, partial [Rhodothermales bacterium]|nr:SpoIIE family protein phosphatase [Rhodothermales bacterium]
GPGEAILLYTDGLTELRSQDGALAGTELLVTIAREAPSLQDLAESLLAASGRQHFDDDVMIFRLKRDGSEESAAL